MPHGLLKPKVVPHKLLKPQAMHYKLLKPKALPHKLLTHEATKLSLHMYIYTINDEKAIQALYNTK